MESTQESKTKRRVRNGGYHLKPDKYVKPENTEEKNKLSLQNSLLVMKSFDSKDVRDELRKASNCKKNDDLEKAIKHLQLALNTLNYAKKMLKQKDRLKAFEYFKNVF